MRPPSRSAAVILAGTGSFHRVVVVGSKAPLLGLLLWTFAQTATGVAAPTVTAAAHFDVYSDPWLLVQSPAADGSVVFGDHVEASARWRIDILSGATHVLVADAISTATRFEETRHVVGVGVGWRGRDGRTLDASWTTSLESDYATHALGLSGGSDLFDRMAHVQASWHVSLEHVGQSDDPTFGEDIRGHTIDLAWRQIVAPGTVLSLLASGSRDRCGAAIGCQANPYRYIGLLPEAGAGDGVLFALRERHPDERWRGALGVRAAHAVGASYALHAGYRFYGDSWRVKGHSVDLAVARSWASERLILRLEGRATTQAPATFYRPRYTTSSMEPEAPAWRTADRELAGLRSLEVATSAALRLPRLGALPPLLATLRLARLWNRAADFAAQPERNSWVLSGGARARF